MPIDRRKRSTNSGEIMKLLDYLKETHKIKNDRQLALRIGVSMPTISKIRNGHNGVSAETKIAIHKAFNMPIVEIESFL
jgi:transcriptional regulator with XRE-family HTH domain